VQPGFPIEPFGNDKPFDVALLMILLVSFLLFSALFADQSFNLFFFSPRSSRSSRINLLIFSSFSPRSSRSSRINLFYLFIIVFRSRLPAAPHFPLVSTIDSTMFRAGIHTCPDRSAWNQPPLRFSNASSAAQPSAATFPTTGDAASGFS
jgi:hypothetical protein